jgi:hypothetical protein
LKIRLVFGFVIGSTVNLAMEIISCWNDLNSSLLITEVNAGARDILIHAPLTQINDNRMNPIRSFGGSPRPQYSRQLEPSPRPPPSISRGDNQQNSAAN